MPVEYNARIFRVTPGDADPVGKAMGYVRLLKAANHGKLPRGGVIVEFADGVYPLAKSWLMDAADSGSPESPILYRAEHAGKAVFTGATVPAWRPVVDERNLSASAGRLPVAARSRVLTAALPEDAVAADFYQASRYMQDELLERAEYEYPLALYQNGVRLEPARWPNAGNAHVQVLTGPVQTNWIYRTSQSLSFGGVDSDGRLPDLQKWRQEDDLYLHGEWSHAYIDVTARPASIDDERGLVTLDARDAQYGIFAEAPFFAFNAVCELDAPGEWALDIRARRIYVWPYEGGSPEVARTKTLLCCSNVTDVAFEGFAFEKARGHAVRFVRCRDVSLVKSAVRRTTGWGVYVEGGRGVRVEGCDLDDLGEGGVWLEGGNIDTLTSSRHVCDNCHIHDYARLAWNYNPGVHLSGCGNAATHNLIHHAPHQACFFYGAENRFAWNVVHDVCRFTDDAGAIYSYNTHNAWAHRGNAIEHNAFHHLCPPKPRYCQLNGIYLDAFTSGTVVRGNIVSETSLGVFSSGGQDNRIERNIVVHARHASVRRWNLGLMDGKNPFEHEIRVRTEGGGLRLVTNRSDRASYLMQPLTDKGELYRMSFWRERFPNQLMPLAMDNPALAHSTHFCTIRNNVAAGCPGVRIIDPEVTRETTVEEDNVVMAGDPGFVDFVGMDWELREDAPARQTLGGGTRFGEMGLYASATRITPPVKWGAGVTPPQPFNAQPDDARWVRWTPADGPAASCADAFCARGLVNVVVAGVPADPVAAQDVCEALSARMERFAWPLDDGSGRPLSEQLSGLADLALMYPKLVRVIAPGLTATERAELEKGLARSAQKPEIVTADPSKEEREKK